MLEYFFSIALMLLFFIFLVGGWGVHIDWGVRFGCRHFFAGYIFNNV